MCRLSWNLGASTGWNPQGLSRPVMGLLYLSIYINSARTSQKTQYTSIRKTNRWMLYTHIIAVHCKNHSTTYIYCMDKIQSFDSMCTVTGETWEETTTRTAVRGNYFLADSNSFLHGSQRVILRIKHSLTLCTKLPSATVVCSRVEQSRVLCLQYSTTTFHDRAIRIGVLGHC